jgi:hypothetical protein
MEDAKS